MQLQRERFFPVPAATLRDVLTSREFYQARFASSRGEDAAQFEAFGDTPAGFRIAVSRALRIKTDRLPAVARKFIGSSATLLTDFLWLERATAPYRCRFSFTLAKVPVKVEGLMQIEECEGGCRQRLSADLSSSVPLIGNKLVALVSGQVDRALDADYEATLAYLNAPDVAGLA